MKVDVDREKCIEGCMLCFESCPNLCSEILMDFNKEELFDFLNSVELKKEVLENCSEKAFEEVPEGIVVVNEDKCIECGSCMLLESPLISKEGKPIKCDLCIDEEDFQCIKTCPYDALSLTHTAREKEEINEKMGYEVKDYTKRESLDEGKIFHVKELIEPVYITGEENFNIHEARLFHKILKKAREADEVEIETAVEQVCCNEGIEVTQSHVKKLVEQALKETTGPSILKLFLEDDELEEISIIGPRKPLYVYHCKEGWLKTDMIITNPEKIKSLINKSARNLNRRITLKDPRINANIDEGRVHGAIKPLATTGNCMTIRKFITNKFKPPDLVKNKTVPPEVMKLLEKTIKCNTNILIAGNTGSGKTTTLNTLLHFLPKEERIILVEETPEINPPQEHVIQLATSPELNIEMHELVTDTLRMRPDRVIVGEVRNEKEVKALMNTMLAGQGKGSIATFHGNSSQETFTRLEGLGATKNDLMAIDLLMIQRRWTNQTNKNQKKEIRRVTELASPEKNQSTPLTMYSSSEGLQIDQLKRTRLMEKLCLSYGQEKEEVAKELEDAEA